MKTAVIFNPQSAGGRTGKRWSRLQALVERELGAVEVCPTERPGHAVELTRSLLRRGFDRIVAAGGDGTCNEVVNGFLEGDRPVRPEASIGILPTGTGGDFQRSLGIPSDPEAAAAVLAAGVPAAIDAGKISYRGRDGGAGVRYFANLASFGMGGEVAERSRNVMGAFGGRAAFLWATVKVLIGYRGRQVEVRLDGADDCLRFRVLNVAAGNGRFHGGGMHVCPRAALDDGILEVTVIEDLGVLTLLRDIRCLYDGNIYDHPKCHHFRARRITAASPDLTRIEVDGEPLGSLPVEITVLPKALRVILPGEGAIPR